VGGDLNRRGGLDRRSAQIRELQVTCSAQRVLYRQRRRAKERKKKKMEHEQPRSGCHFFFKEWSCVTTIRGEITRRRGERGQMG